MQFWLLREKVCRLWKEVGKALKREDGRETGCSPESLWKFERV